MKSTDEPAFEIVDRRRIHVNGEEITFDERPEESAKLVTTLEPEPSGNRGVWADVDYMVIPAQMGPNSFIVLGRCVGKRGDGKGPFVADYVIMPRQPLTTQDFDWRLKAKLRLDTFLGCSCSMAQGPCTMHKKLLPEWQREDHNRAEIMGQQELSPSLELLMKGEQARQRPSLVAASADQIPPHHQMRRR